MDPESHQLFSQAVDMMKNNDPGCIPIFERLDTYSCRSNLAKIYMEGLCGQTIDYDKALIYTKNNPNRFALPIEARINCIIRNNENLNKYYFNELTEFCEKDPENKYARAILAEMYLYGKGTNIDLQQALKLNPRLSDAKTLHWEIQMMDEKTKEAVRQKMLKDPIFMHKMSVFEERKPTTTIDRPNTTREKNQKIWKSRIDDLIWKGGDKEKIEALCSKWFEEEPSAESAFYLIRNIHGLDEEKVDKAIEYMRRSLHVPKYRKAVAHYDTEKRLWDSLEVILNTYDDGELNYYRAKLLIHKGDKEGSIKYLLSAIKQNRTDKGFSSIGIDSIKLLFEIRPEWVTYYRDYTEALLKTNNRYNKDLVGTALYNNGDQTDKRKALEILDENANYFFKSAETMFKITSDEKYKELMDKFSFYRTTSDSYQFNYADDTKTILENYKTLPPKWRLSAMEELIDRFIKGKAYTQRDFNKAADLLIEMIELCDEYKLTSRHAKGRLGLLMFQNKIPCINDELMFGYMYPVRNENPFRNAVIECLLEGRGTEQNIDEAIELLRQSDLRFEMNRLLSIYEEDRYDHKDPKMVAQIIKEMINKGIIDENLSNRLRNLSYEDSESTVELSLSDYTSAKISKLMALGMGSKDDALFKLRCLDFARRLGSTEAGRKEAALLIEEYKKPKVAFTILKESETDASTYVMRKIKMNDQILVDSDKELRKIMNNSSY